VRVAPIFVSSRRFYSPFETCGVARVGVAAPLQAGTALATVPREEYNIIS